MTTLITTSGEVFKINTLQDYHYDDTILVTNTGSYELLQAPIIGSNNELATSISGIVLRGDILFGDEKDLLSILGWIND